MCVKYELRSIHSILFVSLFFLSSCFGCVKNEAKDNPSSPAESEAARKAEADESDKETAEEPAAVESPKKPRTTDGRSGAQMSLEAAVLKIIHRRKSVRHYVDKPVPKVMLEKLVRAGMAAPTAMNKQPWAFVVITERETLDRLGNALPYAKMLLQAPAAIVAAGNMKLAISGKGRDFWVQDVSAAVENILLAAEAMGLGAVWTGVYPRKYQLKTVRETLSLPEHIIPLAVVPVGFPKGVEKPKNKWDAKKLHREKWGQNNGPSLISPAASD